MLSSSHRIPPDRVTSVRAFRLERSLEDVAVRVAWRHPVVILFLLLSTGLLMGCTTAQFVTLREKPHNPVMERLRLGGTERPRPSDRVQRFLAATGCPATSDMQPLLRHAWARAERYPSAEAFHAAAELSYLFAQQTRSHDIALAQELYFDGAGFAWAYITSPGSQGARTDPNDERQRETTELYNSSVEQFVRLVRRSQKNGPLREFRLPLTGRVVSFEIPHPSPWIDREQVGDIEFASDYEIRNLRARHVSPGIGVPIVVQRRRPPVPGVLEEYYAEGLRFPATVVLRFPSVAERAQRDVARLQVYDPRDSHEITVNSTPLPIESDLSTPLARFLTNPDLKLLDTFAFLRPDKAKSLRGLYMVQPYDPNRIPVLMVHGLWSSPVTWMEMFNDLQSDPVLRNNYQFWFYMYPTGEPLAFAQADLRDELRELRQRCDPGGHNGNLDRMVLVGHSMGGLLSYLMTIDSDDRLWNAVSRVPLHHIKADQETHNEIRRVFFFEGNRSIDRVVTIASPFEGSSYANSFTRWLSGSIISLPGKTVQLSRLIFESNRPPCWERMFPDRTSLDSLSKDSAVLRLIAQKRIPEPVLHHNVVGISDGDSERSWTDGVVDFGSAHRADADTEIRVDADHSNVHRHPEAIAEVRRVLLDHLESLRRPVRVTPVHDRSPTGPLLIPMSDQGESQPLPDPEWSDPFDSAGSQKAG